MNDFFMGSPKGTTVQMPLQQELVCSCSVSCLSGVLSRLPTSIQLSFACLSMHIQSMVHAKTVHEKTVHEKNAVWSVHACWQSCHLALVQT